MKKAEVAVKNKAGIHLRPSSLIVQCAESFESSICIEKEGRVANARSPFDLIMLMAPKGTLLTITVEGTDEEAAISAMLDLIDHRQFDEE